MKQSLLFILFFVSLLSNAVAATDLIEVFKESLIKDPTYQQSISEALSNEENVNLSRSSLLPQINFTAQPLLDKQHNKGAMAQFLLPRSNTLRLFDMQLQLSQTIFNFAQFSQLARAKASARQANASLNAALQDLMLRVTKAYFTVLQDEENIAYYQARKNSLSKQLLEVKHRYKSGSKTKIDISTAQAAFSAAESDYISSVTQLAIDKEFLRTITGNDYAQLAPLNHTFPMISPEPAVMEAWVNKGICQNWTIKANQFAVHAARENLRQQFANHFPTIDAHAYYDSLSFFASHGSGIIAAGSSKLRNGIVLLNLNIPIFSGGSVVSETNKAKYKLEMTQQKLDASIRDTIYTIRRSYLLLVSYLHKLSGDKIAVQSAQDSLRGAKERYYIGSETLINTLNHQEKVIHAQVAYAKDRYDYIINLLTLKKAAGTLSIHDLEAVNSWLEKC